MRIGTKVYISNPKLKTHGETGKISFIFGNTYEVRLVNGDLREYRKDNVRPLEEKNTTKAQNDLHVMVYEVSDDSPVFDFSGESPPTIAELEDAFGLSTGRVFIGTMPEIKDEINGSLDSWDYVIGIIDSKPFKASCQIRFEGAINA